MMRYKWMIAGIGLLLITFVVWYFYGYERAIVVSDAVISEEGIDVRYPQVAGMRNASAQQQVNQLIQNNIESFVAEKKSQKQGQRRFSLYSRYSLERNQGHLISLVLTKGFDFGGAHPNSVTTAFTFSTASGQLLNLADLFIQGAPYQDRINAVIISQIAERQLPTFKPFTTIRNDQTFFLTSDSLVIYYQPYEIAAYVFGAVKFVIPFEQLHDILKPELKL